MVTFSEEPTFPRICNTWLVQGDKQIQIEDTTIFLKVFKAQKDILLISKAKILVLIQMVI